NLDPQASFRRTGPPVCDDHLDGRVPCRGWPGACVPLLHATPAPVSAAASVVPFPCFPCPSAVDPSFSGPSFAGPFVSGPDSSGPCSCPDSAVVAAAGLSGRPAAVWTVGSEDSFSVLLPASSFPLPAASSLYRAGP